VNSGTNKMPHKHTSDSGSNWMEGVTRSKGQLGLGNLVK
jgi:hypothetical protein